MNHKPTQSLRDWSAESATDSLTRNWVHESVYYGTQPHPVASTPKCSFFRNRSNSNYSGTQLIDITCYFLIIFTVHPKGP